MGGMTLPPGPREPAALQTAEWIARPTAFLRRCRARHGDPFTVRVAWADAPMVLMSGRRRSGACSPPARRCCTAARLDGAGAVRRPDLDPAHARPRHLRRRRELLPAFHGEALAGWRGTIAELAAAEVATWPAGAPLRTLPRMQALTLDVILRLVLGPEERPDRDAIRRALDMTASLPRLVAMSLHRGATWNAFLRAVEEVDGPAPARDRPRRPRRGLAARHARGSGMGRDGLRDQAVTVLAAGHETTAGSLAWALERLAHHPAAQERVRAGDEAYLDAVVKEVLRVRPVLSIAARGGGAVESPATSPSGVHVAVHLPRPPAPEAWPDPTAFRPERFLEGAPEPGTYLPFGGGVRRCAGAAFAALELREVLRAVLARFALAPPGYSAPSDDPRFGDASRRAVGPS